MCMWVSQFLVWILSYEQKTLRLCQSLSTSMKTSKARNGGIAQTPDTLRWLLGEESSAGPVGCLREELTPRSLLFPAMWRDCRTVSRAYLGLVLISHVCTDRCTCTVHWLLGTAEQSWACLGFVLISHVCTDRCTCTVHRLLYTSKSCLGNNYCCNRDLQSNIGSINKARFLSWEFSFIIKRQRIFCLWVLQYVFTVSRIYCLLLACSFCLHESRLTHLLSQDSRVSL